MCLRRLSVNVYNPLKTPAHSTVFLLLFITVLRRYFLLLLVFFFSTLLSTLASGLLPGNVVLLFQLCILSLLVFYKLQTYQYLTPSLIYVSRKFSSFIYNQRLENICQTLSMVSENSDQLYYNCYRCYHFLTKFTTLVISTFLLLLFILFLVKPLVLFVTISFYTSYQCMVSIIISAYFFLSYLSNQSKCVRINALFILFINDLPQCIQFSSCYLFADDSKLFSTDITFYSMILILLQTGVLQMIYRSITITQSHCFQRQFSLSYDGQRPGHNCLKCSKRPWFTCL